MHAAGTPVVAVADPVRRPRTVLAAGVLAIAGAVVGLLVPLGLLSLVGRVTMPLMGLIWDIPPVWAPGLMFLLGFGLAWGVPAAQLAGAVRLLSGRSRRLLLVSGPVSLLSVGWALSFVVARPDDVGWQVLVVLSALPVVGALLAALPAAGRWVVAGGYPVRPPAPAAGAARTSPSDDLRTPAAAVVAAVLTLIGGVVPLVFGLVGLVVLGAPDDPLSSGRPTAWVAVRLLVMGVMVVGAVLLLAGRSWSVLALSSGVLVVLVIVEEVTSGQGGPLLGAGLLLPLGSTVLAALPDVRRWVAVRRATRPAGGTRSTRRAR